MTARLEPGKRVRRLVSIGGEEYVLELAAGGVSLRQPRKRRPAALMSLAELLERGWHHAIVKRRRERRHKRRGTVRRKGRRLSSRSSR